jgi:hypothetical protein
MKDRNCINCHITFAKFYWLSTMTIPTLLNIINALHALYLDTKQQQQLASGDFDIRIKIPKSKHKEITQCFRKRTIQCMQSKYHLKFTR